VIERVFDTKKHSNVKRKPEYRRIKKNFKSLEQTKREKARRERGLELCLAGWSGDQIAGALGVSRRTVQRDLEKMRETIKRRLAHAVRVGSDEERVRLNRELDGLGPVEQARRIGLQLSGTKKSGRRRECHKLLVKIDVDSFGEGKEALSFRPGFPALVPPYVINFVLVLKGDSRGVGQLVVSGL
jgi:hypothetical protein